MLTLSRESALTSRFFDTRVQCHPMLSNFCIHMKCSDQPYAASTSAALRAYMSPKVNRLALSYNGNLPNTMHISKMQAIAISNVLRPFQATTEVLDVPAWLFFGNHNSPTGKVVSELLEWLGLDGVLYLGGEQVKNFPRNWHYRLSSYMFGHDDYLKDATVKGSWCKRI